MNIFRLLFCIILIFVYVSAQTTSNDTDNNNNIDNIYYSNHNCPAGYDCVGDQVVAPLQSIQPIPCDDGFAGFHCGANYQFDLCESGYYCKTPAIIQRCPEGSYCPQGATEPTKCGELSICPEGSFQFRWLLILIIVLVVITLLVIAKVWHTRLVNKRAALMKLQVEKAAAESRTNSKIGTGTTTDNSDTNSRECSVSIKDGIAIESPNKGDGKRRASTSSVPGVTLSFEHVHVAVKLADGNEKVILHDVNGRFQASKLSAIMGPSGSGKTTFLSALTGRVKSSGNIRINEKHTVQEIQPLTGFVPQADTMYPMLTVRDILTHSAMTRLPAEWTHTQKMSRVERVVDVLGLRRVVDSVVGDEHNRGVSGGEKKRVSIGIELVADPLVLYLDEPTSGLDASSAKDVLSALQRVAKLGTTVITVIHQPRFDIFEMFDDVLFLAKGGYTVYFGPVTECDSHFAALGHVQTEIGNPADFYMDVIHKHYANRAPVINHDLSGSIKIQVAPKTESPQVSRNSSIEMSPVIIHHEKQDDDKSVIDPLQSTPPITTSTIATSSEPIKVTSIATPIIVDPVKVASITPTISISSSLLSRRPVGFLQQTWFYFRLSLLLDLRWLKPIATDTILQFIPGIALGIPSFGQDLYAQPLPLSVAQLCPEIIRDRCINEAIIGQGAIISTFFITMVLGATACIFSVSTFGRYMAVFQREQSTGNNTTTSYWLAKCLYDLLHITRNCFIFLSLYELSASPHSTFGRWFITVWLLQFTAYGLGYFISTIVPFTRATVIAVVVAISLSVTSGLTPSLSTVQNWNVLQVFWYLSYNRWASEAMIAMNVDVASSPGSKDRIAATIRETGYTVDWFSIDMAVLFALGVGYRILTWYMLQRRVRMNKMKKIR